MKKILTVIKRVSSSRVLAVDSANRVSSISTDRDLAIGQGILVVNGTVVAKVSKSNSRAYEV